MKVMVCSWSRLSEQLFRVDKWSVCRGPAAMRRGSGAEVKLDLVSCRQGSSVASGR